MDSLLVLSLVLAICVPLNGLVICLVAKAFLSYMSKTVVVGGQPLETAMTQLRFQQEEVAKTNAARRAMAKPLTAERAMS